MATADPRLSVRNLVGVPGGPERETEEQGAGGSAPLASGVQGGAIAILRGCRGKALTRWGPGGWRETPLAHGYPEDIVSVLSKRRFATPPPPLYTGGMAMVMRCAARADGGGIAAHIRGEIRAQHTDQPRPNGLQGVQLFVNEPEAARAAVDAGRRARKRLKLRGRPPKTTRQELLFAGPPAFDRPEAWDRETTERWARGCLEWVRETFPAATIEAAAAHWDESSPHVHVLLVPTCADGRVSWRHLQREAAERVTGKAFGTNHRAQMSALQDSCWEACGKPFGLTRGQSGSDRRHRPVDYSAVERREREIAEREAELAAREERVDRDLGNLRERKQRLRRTRKDFSTFCKSARTTLDECLAKVRESLTNCGDWQREQLTWLAAAIRTMRDHDGRGRLTRPAERGERHWAEIDRESRSAPRRTPNEIPDRDWGWSR